MRRVLLERAYVLHRRPYRETSFLIEVMTEKHGRISLLAKGVRKVRGNLAGLLQPFYPLLISFSGRNELQTLNQAEPAGIAKQLSGECLFAGFYLNELMIALLQKWDPHPQLYFHYEKTLEALGGSILKQTILRSFEIRLLDELGYGLFPSNNKTLEQLFSPEKYYQFTQEEGFRVVEYSPHSNIFLGKNLLAMANEYWQQDSLQDAKRLIRIVLAPLLGERLIHSRRLFMQPVEES